AGIHCASRRKARWIPAFAGTTASKDPSRDSINRPTDVGEVDTLPSFPRKREPIVRHVAKSKKKSRVRGNDGRGEEPSGRRLLVPLALETEPAQADQPPRRAEHAKSPDAEIGEDLRAEPELPPLRRALLVRRPARRQTLEERVGRLVAGEHDDDAAALVG